MCEFSLHISFIKMCVSYKRIFFYQINKLGNRNYIKDFVRIIFSVKCIIIELEVIFSK